MKTIITAKAPTVHQLNSLSLFGMGYKEHKDGSFTASREFESEQEAKDFLRSRAEQYNSEDPNGSDERLADMYEDIEAGSLRLDAVMAFIEEVEETETK